MLGKQIIAFVQNLRKELYKLPGVAETLIGLMHSLSWEQLSYQKRSPKILLEHS